MHLVQMPVTQALAQQPELYNFEDASIFPQFVRTVIHYDELPPRTGVAFGHFPSHDDWNRMAPTGTVRNLKGREAAVAYRNDDNQPFHYQVMSYDERGRVEALIRYTENIGFDATYYEYNAMNQVIAVRNVDALRQHAVFYGTDHNGRIDEVWSTLGTVLTGASTATPGYPTPLARPSVTPDLTCSYTTRNLVAARTYGQIGWTVDYSYDVRGRMTNLTAAGPGPQDGFSETLSFDQAGQITQQVNSHLKGAVSHTHNFSYDRVRRLTNWAHTDPSTTANFGMSYDEVGNRLSESRPSDPNSYSYTDVNHPNQLSTVNSVSWNTAYWYNANGATKRIRKTWQGGGPFGPAPEEKRLAYDMNGLPVQFEKGIINGSSFEPSELWHYRTAPSGEREQKRQWYMDGTVETAHSYFWTYYGLAGTRQHTVWHGVQQKTDQCNNSGLPERNVWMYPAEYLSYGLSDVAAISENPTLGKTYYIHDHLGSVRVAVKQNGIMSNSIEYEPFGEFIVDYAGLAQLPRLGWIGKERDAETDFGNFGVRNYEFGTGRFLSGDALWEEYRAQSIYHYTDSSPLTGKDPSGMDIIALFVPSGAEGNGHVAVLVGNNTDGWLYVDAYGESFPLGLGGPDKDYTNTYATLEEFMESPKYNSRYQYGYAVVTTVDQDVKAKLAAKEALDREYDARTCNCGDVLDETLQSVGVNLKNSKGTAKVWGMEFDDVTIPNKQMDELEQQIEGNGIDGSKINVYEFYKVDDKFKRVPNLEYIRHVNSRRYFKSRIQHPVRDTPAN